MLITIPFNAESAERAEKLLDWIYFLADKKAHGFCLLVAASDVHEEFRIKVRLAAEMAFESVEVISAKPDFSLFDATAFVVGRDYRVHWLFLEPDCVPLKKGWRKQLETFYENQPKKHIGAHLKTAEGAIILARQSVYGCEPIKPELDLTSASTKCRLIQQGKYTKREDVRTDAVLFCSDKSGELIKVLRSEMKGK